MSERPDGHFLEILKIVNGALAGDKLKVVTYAAQLADKLEADGASRAADKLRRSLQEHPQAEYTHSRLGGARIPVDSESRLPLADQELLAEGSSSVFLDPLAQHLLGEFLRYTRAANELLAQGVGIAPSLLVYGPPGCGKTEIARFIASQLQLPLLTARSDSLISSFLGSTAKNVRMLFESAMSRPCVLFLDEFDALAKKRDDNNELGELKRVVISLLQNIDSLDGKTVIVAATNHEHLLDPAVWRRFSYRLQVTLPTLAARRPMFHKFLGAFAPEDESGLELLAAASEGLTGADIKNACEDSIREAVLDGQSKVAHPAVLRRILRFRFGHAYSGLPSDENIRAVRNLDPDLFTYRVLEKLFGVSLGKISRLLSEKEEDSGGQDTAAD